jgi:signal transduction histidine kinase
MASFRPTRTGRDWSSWPVLLLLLTVLVPTGGVVWMMRAAMENERLAMTQRLTEAYKLQLNAARTRLHDRWSEEMQHMAGAAAAALPSAAFARIVHGGFADSVLVLDGAGRPAYPGAAETALPVAQDAAWAAAERLEFSERDPAAAAEAYAALAAGQTPLAARAQQAQARCLLKTGDRDQAIHVLRTLAEQPEATDAAGRWLAADAQLRLLELLEASSPPWKAVAQLLRRRLSDYDGPLPAAEQRRFLMHRLTALDPGGTSFSTLPAEDLAAQALETLAQEATGLNLAEVAPGATIAPLTAEGITDAWAMPLTNADGRAIALFRTATLQRFFQDALAEPSLPADVILTALAPGATPRDEAHAERLGDPFPGWTVALEIGGGQSVLASAGRRAVLAWTAAAIVALTVTLAWLAAQAIRRQMRVASLKNDLVATVSHELKTPLAAIRLLVDSLLEADGEPAVNSGGSGGKTREYLQLISQENARLTRLIDNFLTFSRIDRGKHQFTFQSIDAAEIVRIAAAAVANRFDGEHAELHVDVESPLPIRGDADALVTAVVNLLDNAWKYTSEVKRVTLAASRRDGRVEISVSDNGVGLARRAARRIFDRFYQVDQQLSRIQGGCGLGLSIVRSIVEAHRGTASVESKPNEGSKFTLSLPLDARVSTPAGGTPASGQPHKPASNSVSV